MKIMKSKNKNLCCNVANVTSVANTQSQCPIAIRQNWIW